MIRSVFVIPVQDKMILLSCLFFRISDHFPEDHGWTLARKMTPVPFYEKVFVLKKS